MAPSLSLLAPLHLRHFSIIVNRTLGGILPDQAQIRCDGLTQRGVSFHVVPVRTLATGNISAQELQVAWVLRKQKSPSLLPRERGACFSCSTSAARLPAHRVGTRTGTRACRLRPGLPSSAHTSSSTSRCSSWEVGQSVCPARWGATCLCTSGRLCGSGASARHAWSTSLLPVPARWWV